MKIKKIFTVFICATLIATCSFSVSCKKSGESDDNKNGEVTNYFTSEQYKEEYYSSYKKLNVVNGGQPKYALVVPDETSDLLNFAIEDFNYFMFKSADCELPVVTENESLPSGISHFISVGKTNRFKEKSFSINYESLKNDGFAVNCKDDDIYIDANNERGLMYGLYDLLKRYMGVRFLSHDTNYIPQKNTVDFYEYNYYLAPEFSQRAFLTYDLSQKWLARSTSYGEFSNGVIETDWATEYGNIHTILNYIKPSEYRESHPEFFSSYTNSAFLVNDQTECVCFSNGITDNGKIDESKDISVAKIVTDKIIGTLKNNPKKQFFMIGISDWYNNYCLCDVCQRRETVLGTKSGIVTMFVNAVVNAVNEWAKTDEAKSLGVDHEVNVIEFAYYWTVDPPVKKENGKWVAYNELSVPNKNVYVRYAPLNANYAYSLGSENQLQRYKDIVEGWHAVSNNLMMYDYCELSNFEAAYIPYIQNISEQAKYLKNNGFCYWMVESIYYTDGMWYDEMASYVCQKLWWNIDYNVTDAVNEFIELYNGTDAAPYIKDYVKLMEETYAKLKSGKGYSLYVTQKESVTPQNYPKELLEKAISILEKAETAINRNDKLSVEEKNNYLRRLDEVKAGPYVLVLSNYDSYYTTDKETFKNKFKSICENANIKSVAMVSLQEYLNNI